MTDDYRRRLALLLFIAAVVLLAGLGLRDPWPADEPRFALIARDMAEGGSWLLPRVGGVLYPDKPPLFFWLVAALYAITGSLKSAFLLPGVLAGLGTLWLVSDLGRRLWGPQAGIWCGVSLLALMQFPLQMKSGQIDGVLCFLTTMSLYALSRHLLLGPDWRWYAAGGFFAGLGVITKGVGFLPLLVLLPYAWALRAGWPVSRAPDGGGARWLLAPVLFLLPIAAWLLPMLLAATGDPDVAAYRDNILFHQTITRYADSWGHIKPPWYLWTHAVPWLWLPASFLLPWLIPAWRKDLAARNAPVLMLGAWVLLVLLFFSFSDGKRSLYIFPAAPAFAMIVGYHADRLLGRTGVQRLLVAVPSMIATVILAAALYALANPQELNAWIPDGFVVLKLSGLLLATGFAMLLAVGLFRRRRAGLAYASSMCVFWLGLSLLVAPAIDGTRSGRDLIRAVDARIGPETELGFVAWPEQFLLQWNQPAVHFGYRRAAAEDLRDALRWVAGTGNRQLLLPATVLEPCFDPAVLVTIGRAHRRDWVLAGRDAISPDCAPGGAEPEQLVHYVPAAGQRLSLASGADSDGKAVPGQGLRGIGGTAR